MTNKTPLNASAKALTHREIMIILGGLMTGLFLAALDQTIVSTALKNIVEEFDGPNHLGKQQSINRANDLLERFSLTDSARRPIKTYSGGMRRRLDLAASLIVQPKVLFLDEPTTGLDPRGRMEMWGVIEELVTGGVTVLLTTQYLEEADQLADEIAVIDHGTVIARGTSDVLKKQVGGERLEITAENQDLAKVQEIIAGISASATHIDGRTVSAPVSTGSSALIQALRALDEASIHPLDIALKRPSLDDVFLSLTGHVAEESLPEPVKKKKRGGK